MPFVLICGFPCSKKTTRAKEIKEFLEQKHSQNVEIVSDQSMDVQRNTVYSDSKQEKEIRGNLKSAVQRLISKENIVILDSLNYIKGFRYELFCITKASQTPHCVIFCDINKDEGWDLNSKREESEQYSKEVFDGLVMRFEAPNPNQRWDSPLFTVQSDDELPFEQITDALLHRKAPPPNMATQNQPLSSTNFLYELDKVTQETVQGVMEAQKIAMPGDVISVKGAAEKITLTRHLTLGELQRLKRQFITYTKSHPIDNVDRLCNMFVQYLNKYIS